MPHEIERQDASSGGRESRYGRFSDLRRIAPNPIPSTIAGGHTHLTSEASTSDPRSEKKLEILDAIGCQPGVLPSLSADAISAKSD